MLNEFYVFLEEGMIYQTQTFARHFHRIFLENGQKAKSSEFWGCGGGVRIGSDADLHVNLANQKDVALIIILRNSSWLFVYFLMSADLLLVFLFTGSTHMQIDWELYDSCSLTSYFFKESRW